jgi:hypothetical protein
LVAVFVCVKVARNRGKVQKKEVMMILSLQEKRDKDWFFFYCFIEAVDGIVDSLG